MNSTIWKVDLANNSTLIKYVQWKNTYKNILDSAVVLLAKGTKPHVII